MAWPDQTSVEIIASRAAKVTLTPTSPPDYGIPVGIVVETRKLSLRSDCTLIKVAEFVEALEQSHALLSGKVALRSVSDEFVLELEVNAQGGVAVAIHSDDFFGEIVSHRATIEFGLDQSYLPGIAAAASRLIQPEVVL